MDVSLSPQDLAFRDEVRAFLDQAFDPALRAETARQAGVFAEPAVAQRWHKALYDKGWITPAWPVEYGGTGWTTMQRYIFQSECARAGTPSLPAMGLSLCAPVIMRFGTQAQKDWFLPRMRSGEVFFCQGYSEPQSGSDLASLQTRAVRDGDDYVVDGGKIWTTHAHFANWIFMLVRTSTEGRPQAGISFLLSPMDAPGLSVRPILSMSGEHEVNQVFFDGVRVPVKNRVGEENQGWTLAKYLLEFERGGGFAGAGLVRQAAGARDMAEAERGDDGARLADDADFARDVALAEIEALALDATEQRIAFTRDDDGAIGDAGASLKKLRTSELSQTMSELKMKALGPYATADQRASLGVGANEPPIGPEYAALPTARYLNTRAATIYGGSSEVQRNILARAVLGLGGR